MEEGAASGLALSWALASAWRPPWALPLPAAPDAQPRPADVQQHFLREFYRKFMKIHEKNIEDSINSVNLKETA